MRVLSPAKRAIDPEMLTCRGREEE